MVRVASGTGRVQPPLADKALAAVVAAWSKAARVDIQGPWSSTEPEPVATQLGQAMRQANATKPGAATTGLRAAMVAVTVQSAPKGELHSDLAPAHRAFLAAFARAAGILLHVHVMLPGRGADAELAAAAALGQAWPLPAPIVAAEPSSALPRDRLLAAGRDVAGSTPERKDLPEVAGARRRAAEVRRPAKKKAS